MKEIWRRLRKANTPIEQTTVPKNYIGKTEKEVLGVIKKHADDLLKREHVRGYVMGDMATENEHEYIRTIDIFLENDPSPEELAAMQQNIEGIPVQYVPNMDFQAFSEIPTSNF